MGSVDKDGYGKFQLNSGGKQKHVRAHRFALFAHTGRWPARSVLHSCDNPKCCNPEHLAEGSQTENLIQCAERARRMGQRLTPAMVLDLRARLARGERVTDIARCWGIPRETLYAAAHGRTWWWVK
jgi:hypothetical protein